VEATGGAGHGVSVGGDPHSVNARAVVLSRFRQNQAEPHRFWWAACAAPASSASRHGERGAACRLLGQPRQRPSGPATCTTSSCDHSRVHPAITAPASVIRSLGFPSVCMPGEGPGGRWRLDLSPGTSHLPPSVVRNGSLVRRRQLARTLRELRVHAGLTIEAAAPLLDFSPSKLSRIENAHQGVDVHIVRSMLDLFDVGGDRWKEILELTREASAKGWWRAYGLDDKGYLPSSRKPARCGTTR
jgi:transcriptional regulator with XRE-family HTH domain